MLRFIVPCVFFLSLSHGAASHPHHPPLEGGIIKKGDDHTRASWELVLNGRSLVNAASGSVDFAGNNTMILAEKRTRRKDPLDDFKYYRGGWNISNKHYMASAAYTAAPLIVITIIWFLGFAVILLAICIRHCCCQLSNYGYSRTAYAVSLAFLIFFTTASIVGCIVLSTGQEKFRRGTTSTFNYVVNQADDTVDKLTNVSKNLAAAKGISVDQISLPTVILENINKVENRINTSATNLQRETDRNKDRIKKVLNAVRVTLIIVAAVMLLLTALGFLLSIFGMQSVVYTLAIAGWVLATIALALCCVFVVLNNVVGDTCVAMDEWVQNPAAHTALDDILPCVDNATAQETLSQSENVIFQLVNVVNFVIINVTNVDPPPNLPPNMPPLSRLLYYNQSGPLVPLICNPFNSDLTDRTCATGEVDLSNASQELRNFVCQVSANGSCSTVGRLTPEFYDQMVTATNLGYSLQHNGPFLVNLIDCTFVRETFRSISEQHCPDLKRYNKLILIGLLMVSIDVMFSLVFWVIYARERRHRVYAHLLTDSSPQHSTERGSDSSVK